MSVVQNTWRFLLQRRLLPIAIILIAAVVAVPRLLATEPIPPAPAPPTATVKGDQASVLTTEPIVSPASDADRSGRRRVLGSEKNPFKPQVTPTPTPGPTEATGPATADTPAATDPGAAAGGGAAAPSPTTPVPTTPPAAKKQYELNELTVRFGSSDADRPPRKDVKRLQALPSNEEPVLIYLGVLKDKKTSVFLLRDGTVAQGDATCRPSRTVCETIEMKEGETEFLDIPAEETVDGAEAQGEAQYQLEVLKIRKQVTTSAKQAKQSLARVSKAGHKILKARIAGDGPLHYEFNTRTGRLEKRSHKAYKAIVAKAARARF